MVQMLPQTTAAPVELCDLDLNSVRSFLNHPD